MRILLPAVARLQQQQQRTRVEVVVFPEKVSIQNVRSESGINYADENSDG
jgi:hypothetical protein